MKKRILSMILAVVMVFTSVDITAFAQEQVGVEVEDTTTEDDAVQVDEVTGESTYMPVEEPTAELDRNQEVGDDTSSTIIDSGKCGDDVTWTLEEGGQLIISGTGAMEDYSDYRSAPWYEYEDMLTSLTIEEGITYIGCSAFECCYGLKGSLVIPNSVTSIGALAFSNCYGFDGSLSIGNGVTSIGDSAFRNCESFSGDLVIPDSVISIGDSAFESCFGFSGDLIISDSVTSIGDFAFASCTGFSGDLVISDGVTSIGDSVFEYCEGFSGNLVIPDNVTSIGDSAFVGCAGFSGDLVIPDGVTSVGDSAFSGCVGFNGDLVIPNSVINIGNYAFMSCYRFNGDLVIPNSVTSIGEHAFYNCYGFGGDLVIPDSVISIGDYAFKKCTGLSGKAYIPDSVTSIGSDALATINVIYGVSGSYVETYAKEHNISFITDEIPEGDSYLGTEGTDEDITYLTITMSELEVVSDDNIIDILKGREDEGKKYNKIFLEYGDLLTEKCISAEVWNAVVNILEPDAEEIYSDLIVAYNSEVNEDIRWGFSFPETTTSDIELGMTLTMSEKENGGATISLVNTNFPCSEVTLNSYARSSDMIGKYECACGTEEKELSVYDAGNELVEGIWVGYIPYTYNRCVRLYDIKKLNSGVEYSLIIEAAVSGDEDRIEFNGHYYKAFDMDMTWKEAKEYCESLGGYLATVTNEEENNFVYSLAKEVTDKDCWLGATDEEEEGVWKWVTGEKWSYTNWSKNEPNNREEFSPSVGEDYLQIYLQVEITKKWNDTLNDNVDTKGNDRPCGFVCEWGEVEETPTDEPEYENRIEFNGHYYKAFDMDMTWKEAKAYCENLGGYLVTVTSKEENDFVYSISLAVNGLDCWLGATDEMEEGKWRWVTGERWNYTNWHKGNPDDNKYSNPLVGEDYLQIWKKGTWNDNLLDNINESGKNIASGFVCEWGEVDASEKEHVSEYLIQVVDEKSLLGIGNVTVSYEGSSYVTDGNGVVTILSYDEEIKGVYFSHKDYESQYVDVSFKDNDWMVVKLAKTVNICPPDINMNQQMDFEGGEINHDDAQFKAIDFPFDFSLKTKMKRESTKTEDKNGWTTEDKESAIPFNVSVDANKRQIKISYGVPGLFNEESTEKEKEVLYNRTQQLIKECKAEGKYEDAIKRIEKSGASYTRSKVGVGVKTYALGYMTISYEKGYYEMVESEALIGISGSGSFEYRPVCMGGIAYGKIELELSVEGSVVFKLDPELAKIASMFELNLEQALTLAVGVGGDFAHIELGAEGKFKEKFVFDGDFNKEEDITVTFSATPYVEGKVWIFTAKAEYDSWKDMQVWPKQKQADNMREISLQQLGEESDYEMVGREYLTQSVDFEGVQNPGNNVLNRENVYSDGRPQICELADGTRVAAWIDDDGTKGDADRTTLYYAVLKDGMWGEAKAVKETGRGDYYPTLIAKGDSAYISWINADKEYGNETTVEELSANTSIYLSTFINSEGVFGEPISITPVGNGKMAHYIDIASDGNEVSVTWVENSVNSIYMGAGTNSIYRRTLLDGKVSEIEVLAEDLKCIYDMDTEYVGEEYVLAWCEDVDGSLTTGEDVEMFLFTENGKSKLTSNNAEESNVHIVRDDLYYISDGSVCRMRDFDINCIENTGLLISGDFKVVQGERGKAILWLEKDGFVNYPVISYEKGDAYTKPVILQDMGTINISYFSAIYETDGTISMLMNKRTVDPEWSEKWEQENLQSPYGNTSMYYYEDLLASDIIVDEDLYYESYLALPGAKVEFSTDVYNATDQEINNLSLMLMRDGSVVETEEIETSLSVGDDVEVSIEHVLPEDLSSKEYSLVVSTTDINESITDNNTATTLVGYGNLELKNFEVKKENDDTAIISGALVNSGCETITDITFKAEQLGLGEKGHESRELMPEDIKRKVISEESGFALAPREEKHIRICVSEDIDFTNAFDDKRFYFSVEGSGKETNYADNSLNLLLSPIKTDSISLGEDVTLTIGESKQLETVILPENAYAECIYTSSNLDVLIVDQTGKITAMRAGEAEVTVVSADGRSSDTVNVLVLEVETSANITYNLDNEELTLEQGEGFQLNLLWEGIVSDENETLSKDELVWSSSNEDIVSIVTEDVGLLEETDINIVGSTLISANSGGMAIITVATEEAVLGSCIVSVVDRRMRTLSFEEKSIELNKGEEYLLKVNSSPQVDTVEYFDFKSSNENVIKVDEKGKVTAMAEGMAIIEVTYNQREEDEDIVKDVCQIIVNDPSKYMYSLSFDSNGGSTIAEQKAHQLVAWGETYIFPEEPTKPGYYFGGWNTQKDAKGIAYKGSETLVAGQDLSDGLILYAIWIPFADGLWAAAVPDQVFTGKEIKPNVAVYDGTKLLTKGVDYSLSYKNNIEVAKSNKKKNPPTITVKGKGNYKGTQTITFTILPRDVASDKDIVISDILVKANGKVQKKVPTVKYNGKKLEKNKDFTVSYPDLATNSKAYKEPGEYTILVKGKGGYTGQREVKLTITESKLMSKVAVSKIAPQPYTGEAVTIATMRKAPTVKYGDKKLKEGTHYTVSYENNVKVGTATMILTGTDTETPEGTFTGTKKVTFKIGGTSLAKAKVTGVPESMTYTGTEIDEQTEGWGNPIKVELKGDELTRAADAESEGDYMVTYKNNLKKGTATVTIKGVNSYSGSIKKEFTINAYNINDNAKQNLVTEEMDTETVYAKGGSKPEPVVKFGDTTLVKGKDYTLTYANNTKWHDGTSTTKRPTVTITGKGNFKGTVKIPYTIAKQDIGNMKISASDVVYKKEKGAYKATPVVKDLDNKILKNKTDYTVTSYTYGQDVTLKNGTERKAGETVGKNDIVPAGTLLKVAVTGKGNYTGNTPLVAEYRVVKSGIANAKVTVPSQPYTGKPITIEDKTKIKVKVGKTKLDPEDFEIVDGSFKNNTKAGTASFTIRGIGNYGGTKKVTFKIKPKGFIWWWRQ